MARRAERQHGVVSRRQLLELGFSRGQIGRLIRDGHLHEVHRGVYAVGRRRLAREGEWMAGVLALGSDAALSQISAAMLWRLIDLADHYPHAICPGNTRRRPRTITHTAMLGRDETSIRDGIPVTSVSRTILDLATMLDPLAIEGALGQAEFHGYAIRPSFAALLDRHRGHRGIATLRAVLSSGHHTLGVTESPLEVRFLRFLDERGLERPELNVPLDLGGYPARPDGLYRRARDDCRRRPSSSARYGFGVSDEPATRGTYRHFLPIQTRWNDNDVYGHVNNIEYYGYFDTVINHWLITEGGLDIHDQDIVGLCVESHCSYRSAVSFPGTIEAGLRVAHLGRSSVRYEIGIFDPDDDQASAEGWFVHVFVEAESWKSTEIPAGIRDALERLEVDR